MKDYKKVLKISAKSEFSVAIYLCACFLSGLSILSFFIKPSLALLSCFLISFYLFIKAWQRHYLLTHQLSILTVCFDHNDQITISLRNGEIVNAQLVDTFFIGQNLVLYFSKMDESFVRTYSTHSVYRFVRFRKWFSQSMSQLMSDIGLVLRLNSNIFITSESTLGSNNFRELLRRVYL